MLLSVTMHFQISIFVQSLPSAYRLVTCWLWVMTDKLPLQDFAIHRGGRHRNRDAILVQFSNDQTFHPRLKFVAWNLIWRTMAPTNTLNTGKHRWTSYRITVKLQMETQKIILLSIVAKVPRTSAIHSSTCLFNLFPQKSYLLFKHITQIPISPEGLRKRGFSFTGQKLSGWMKQIFHSWLFYPWVV